MSFWATLEHDLGVVGRDALEVATIAGPIIGIVNPVWGAIITGTAGRLTSSIFTVEKTIDGVKAGDLRAATVKSDFDNALALASEITGKTMSYDPAAMQAAIDHGVAYFNALAALKASLAAH